MERFWVRVGSDLLPARVNHWWPEREWEGPSPIPRFLVKEAERRGSKYLTMAVVILPEMDFAEVAYCNPVDTPSRKMGRHIALGRLRKRLMDAGYEVVDDAEE